MSVFRLLPACLIMCCSCCAVCVCALSPRTPAAMSPACLSPALMSVFSRCRLSSFHAACFIFQMNECLFCLIRLSPRRSVQPFFAYGYATRAHAMRICANAMMRSARAARCRRARKRHGARLRALLRARNGVIAKPCAAGGARALFSCRRVSVPFKTPTHAMPPKPLTATCRLPHSTLLRRCRCPLLPTNATMSATTPGEVWIYGRESEGSAYGWVGVRERRVHRGE